MVNSVRGGGGSGVTRRSGNHSVSSSSSPSRTSSSSCPTSPLLLLLLLLDRFPLDPTLRHRAPRTAGMLLPPSSICAVSLSGLVWCLFLAALIAPVMGAPGSGGVSEGLVELDTRGRMGRSIGGGFVLLWIGIRGWVGFWRGSLVLESRVVHM